MSSTFALALLTLMAPLQAPTGSVRGQVRSDRTAEPVPYAVVEVLGAPVPLVTVADSAGLYLLRGVPAGPRVIRVRGIDHAGLEVQVLVRAGRETVVDLELAFRPVVLAPVAVEVQRDLPPLADTLPAPAPDLGRATTRSLEATPGVAELGLGEIVGRPPGQEPVDPSDVLYVRGAPADLKLVLLDGAPIYAPFHLGGLIRPFEDDVLSGAELYLGGAPARYDGGLSYVLDLETRAGRRNGLHLSGGADLMAAQALLEGPLGGGAGFLIGGRSVHGHGMGWLLREAFPYRYAEALGRVDVGLGGPGAVAATGFWNRESVRLDGGATGDAEWGNAAGSLRFRGRILEAAAELTAAFGGYDASLPLGDSLRALIADGAARRVRVAADFIRPVGGVRFHYGVSYERMSLVYHVRDGVVGPESDGLVLETAAQGDAGGAYIDLGAQPAPHLRLRGGLRADVFSADRAPRLAPRIAATWALSDRAALTLAAGRYGQFMRSGGPQLIRGPGSTTSLRVPPLLTLASSSHLLIGLDQMLTDELRLGVEGYFKRFEGLPGYAASGPTAAAADGGRARASGVDFWLRRSEGPVTGWLGYSLAWVWSVTGPGATELFSGRQLLSAGVEGSLGGRGRFDLRLAYGAGLPYTAIPSAAAPDFDTAERSTVAVAGATRAALDGPPLGGDPPDEPYLRLDAEVSHPWTTEWGGRRMTIAPYLKILNALDRRDALFYRADGGDPRPLAALPLLPVLGVSWRF